VQFVADQFGSTKPSTILFAILFQFSMSVDFDIFDEIKITHYSYFVPTSFLDDSFKSSLLASFNKKSNSVKGS